MLVELHLKGAIGWTQKLLMEDKQNRWSLTFRQVVIV